MVDLDIVILNYNAGDFLLRCLASLQKVKDEANFKVTVIDNVSADGSFIKARKKFPQYTYIQNNKNSGFAAGNNIGLKKAKSKYVLLLNPDTQLEKGVLKTCLSYMEEHSEVGASTCKVVLSNGQMDLTAHRGFPTPWASLLYFLGNDSLYHLTSRNLNIIHEVDAITGAFFLTRKSVLDKVGLLDEDYFMYAEDIDLCFRIKEAGFKIMYIPTVSIIHYKGISSGLKKHSQEQTTASIETKKRSLDAFYSTMIIFYKKHLEKRYPFFVNWFIYLAIHLKWYLAKQKLTV